MLRNSGSSLKLHENAIISKSFMNTDFSLKWHTNPKYVNINTLTHLHTDKRDRIKKLMVFCTYCVAW